MSGAHTPGPWRVIIDDAGNPLSGRPGVFSDEHDCGIVHWDGFVQTYWRSARGDKEIHANARLIAAAPQLLEALEAAEKHFGPFAEITINGIHDAEDVRVVALIRAAITRARTGDT
ncbi:MAG TPA: hypothetical protein VKB96_10960 [Gammaproteobacteria bacterium]|nr:hypothetical protein [Gammaproteobacteria bacterium]